MKKIWILSGLPGSGKSTWVKNRIKSEGDSCSSIIVSRDEIRFNLLKDNEEYFSKEDKVFSIFINTINKVLENPSITEIFVDATHLNDKARNKVLNRLNTNFVNEIVILIFDVPLETCIERNSKRTGRALVPTEVIVNMNKSFQKTSSIPKAEVIVLKEIY